MRAHPRTVVGIVAAASLALAVAACGGDDDNVAETSSVTTAAGTTQAPTSSAAPSTAAPATTEATSSSSSAPEPDPDHTCPHITNVVLVKSLDNPVLNTSNVDVTEIPPERVPETLGWEEPPDINLVETVAAMFNDNQISAYEVNDLSDSLDVAEQIMTDSTNVIASPVLLLTLTGHWTLSPADDPQPATVEGNVPNDTVADPPVVAVVDTGYTDAGGDFEWLDVRVDPVDSTNAPSFDAEPTQSPTQSSLPPSVAGHGIFVSSIIAQGAPNVNVRVARLGALDPQLPTSLTPPGFSADELQLYVAITRLLNLKLSYAALNLSLGAYSCEKLGDVDKSGLAIRAAIDLWIGHSWGGATPPIVAAAGNHRSGYTDPLPSFIPAKYDTGDGDSIYPVMAVDQAGNQSTFSNEATIGALGERLIGVGPNVPQWTYWSGSSFAAALLTARTLIDGSIPENTMVDAADHIETEPTTTTTLG